MRGLLYIVKRDFGFAPNPFGNMCTLATCKAGIRNAANIGDWVIGMMPKRRFEESKLVYAMKVNGKMTFDEYWTNPGFQYKKPVMNGSLVQNYGDNIYHTVNGEWCQADSHHSLEYGVCNYANLNRDTRSHFVLSSTHFFYFGREAVPIPVKYTESICWNGRNFKWVPNQADLEDFVLWLERNYSPGLHADPLLFGKKFERYDGNS